MSKVLERRNSIGGTTSRSSASDSGKAEKTVPHYLRASAGSCHDLCKFGHKHPSEEEKKLSGGRRKKLPNQLNNLTLHRSAILDRSKDVKHRNISLAKSSISLGEADHSRSKSTSASSKDVSSYEPLVPWTDLSADQKSMNAGGRKKQSVVEQKPPAANTRNSKGVHKFDQRAIMPGKEAIPAAKLKLAEKIMPEKLRTVEKAALVKQPLLRTPTSLPTKLNLIKQTPTLSQTYDMHTKCPSSSKDKNAPKGKIMTQPTTSSNSCAHHKNDDKSGRTPMRSSMAKIKGKEGMDMSRPSFSAESDITVSVKIHEDFTGQESCKVSLDSFEQPSQDQQLSELSSAAKECVSKSLSAQEETNRSNSEDDGVERTKIGEPLECDAPLKSQQSSDGQEVESVISKSDPEHKQVEQHASNGRISKDEDNQTDDAVLQNEVDGVKVITNVESVIAQGKRIVGADKNLEGSPEQLALDEKLILESEPTLNKRIDCTSGYIAEGIKLEEVNADSKNSTTSHHKSISDASSDGELLEEPKAVLIEPSDCTVQNAKLASAKNDDSCEQVEMKPSTAIEQLPEELSDDEFSEEYDFELSESDESGSEDEGAAINRNNDESSKADGQRPRRSSAFYLDGASAKPYKMKFKRGKVVELPTDSNSPRRLKFRRRAASEVASGDGQPATRIYKRNVTNAAVPTNREAPGVKLRHQDTQGKKDAQGLFNNVIEETASKLVESRKSKVKALVGAFETVISLQDGKPTTSTPQAGNSPHSVHDDDGNAPEGAA